MAAPVQHQFTSGKSDSVDTTLVRPSNWNANHKATGGAVGQALVWDAAASPENLSWGRFDHFNFVFNADLEIWGGGTSNALPTGFTQLSGAATAVSKNT